MRAIALVDLDDTLFQTIRKCPPDVPQDRLTAMGFAKDGSPLSYATPRQMQLVQWLDETAWLIPVTARSRDALMRVKIRFTAGVCAHGGVIIGEDGAVDPEWHTHALVEAATHADDLDRLTALIAEEAGRRKVRLRVRVLDEEGLGLYVLAKHEEVDDAALHDTVDAMAHEVPGGWTVHRNGNNVALMPPWLGKAKAVEALLPRLRARFPDAPVIGIGDSVTDAPYLSLCDFAAMPTGSQLSAAALEPLL